MHTNNRKPERPRKGALRPRAVRAVAIDVALSRSSDTALFVQIRDQVRGLIERGVLRPGMRLPPVRALAGKLKVNQITVAKAYRELVETGLVEGRRGGGTFVRGFSGVTVRASDAGRAPTQPMMAERLYELARAPGVISFSSNYPRLDAGSIAEFKACVSSALELHLESLMQYELPGGRPEAREQISRLLREQGMAVDASEVILTSGAQQGIDLAVRALCQPGTGALIEQPAYYGAINALRLAQARILDVSGDEEGPDLFAVEEGLKRGKARVIYLNPTFQNPSGVTMSLARRQSILTLAARYGAIMIEDDHASDLRYRGAPVPAIRALPGAEDHVIYVRTLGKTVLPGTRLGFMAAPPALLQRLLLMKANSDLHSNGLMQLALARFLEGRNYPLLLERLRDVYRARQSKLFSALKAGLPANCRLDCPEGGLSFWLTLPEDADTSELYFRAVRRGVAFVDGSVFYAFEPKSRSMRLSFGRLEEGQLMEGVERLCSLVNDLQRRVRSKSLVLT
jgi:2-aminoadipate transaminase